MTARRAAINRITMPQESMDKARHLFSTKTVLARVVPWHQKAATPPREAAGWEHGLANENTRSGKSARECWARLEVWTGRCLPRPRHAIDLVRLTVGISWITIGWRRRTAHPPWRWCGRHPAARVARNFLGVELVGYVVASARAPASGSTMMTRLYPMHMRAHRFAVRRCR